MGILESSADTWEHLVGDVDAATLVVFGLLEALARSWKAMHIRALAEFDLNHAEWTAIVMLRASPPDHRRSPTELRRLVGQTSAGMTRILRKLSREGLVTREQRTDDERGRDVILTEQGQRLADSTFLAMQTIQRASLAGLSGADMRATTTALRRLLTALTADRSAGTG